MNKLLLIPILFSVLYYYRRPKIWDELHFPAVEIRTPPNFTGVLAQNQLLQNGKKLFENKFVGPESALVEGDTIYITVDEAIVKIVNHNIEKILTYKGGRPLGIRRLNHDTLIFADGHKGLISVNFDTEKFYTLIPIGQIVEGKAIMFVDDVDVINETEVIFTDASWIASHGNEASIFVGGVDSGRVFKYNLETKQLDLLMDHLHFANGIQLFPDKKSFIVCETLTSTIWRYYLNGTKQGHAKEFINNLPGYPDNVRISQDENSFYIAFCITRIPDNFNSLDFMMKYPTLRWFLFNIIPHWIHTYLLPSFHYHDYGLFIQINLQGEIIKSYHAPNGIFNHLSQITDAGDKLYISSFINPYFAVINK